MQSIASFFSKQNAEDTPVLHAQRTNITVSYLQYVRESGRYSRRSVEGWEKEGIFADITGPVIDVYEISK